MSSQFQTIVKKNVSLQHRHDAIDDLIERGDRTNLSVLVQCGGLSGELRRHALEGLGQCRASEQLEQLATDPAIEPSLQRRAEELS